MPENKSTLEDSPFWVFFNVHFIWIETALVHNKMFDKNLIKTIHVSTISFVKILINL